MPGAQLSRTARLAALFKAHPGPWLDGLAIQRVAGAYAWRTRISDVRREFGLEIENRQRRETSPNGETITRSEYRLRPRGEPDEGAAGCAPTQTAAV